MSAIVPLAKTHVVERHEHRLATAWIRVEQATAPAPSGRWLTHEDEPNVRSAEPDPEGPVLIMLGSSTSPAMAELLLHGRAGARVYVLAPSWWEPTAPALARCPRVLVRRVAEVPVSAVHTAHGSQVWIGSTVGGPTPWRLQLDGEQAAALRQLLLRAFWHDAFDEAWLGAERPTFRPAAARPFDVPEPATDAAARWMEAHATLEVRRMDQRAYLNGGSVPSARMKRLWFPPGGSHHAALARLVRDGATVGWDDCALPDLVTDGHEGHVLLPGTHGRLRIRLCEAQAAELATRLDGPCAWSFGLDVRLGDHGGDGARLWLPDAKEAQPVDPEQIIDLSDVRAPELHGMDEVMPAQWPEPHPLSLTARYRWTVHPPRVPGKAKEDALVGRWRELDARWSARRSRLEQALGSAGEHRGRLAKAFAGLVRALVGFGRTHEVLAGEVAALAAECPSQAGPVQAPALLERLAALESRASQLQTDQEHAEHEARVEQERQRQLVAWTERVEAAKRERPGKQAELEKAQARQAVLASELDEVEQGLAAPGGSKQARKDLEARHKKLGDERTCLEQRLARLRGELEALERQATEPFTFTPPARAKLSAKGSAKGRFVPAATVAATIPVPEEALPEVGTLRSLKGQRYLVIDAWEQLELGQRAARRLRARLCAPEDT